jgi:hypothetical protein
VAEYEGMMVAIEDWKESLPGYSDGGWQDKGELYLSEPGNLSQRELAQIKDVIKTGLEIQSHLKEVFTNWGLPTDDSEVIRIYEGGLGGMAELAVGLAWFGIF